MVEARKTPDPVDIRVGARLRLRRISLGISQEKLGEHLGITFQQIQKYEKGTNRISASRLQKISEVLSVPITYLFEEADPPPSGLGVLSESPSEFVHDDPPSNETLQLMRAFQRIADPMVRRRVVDLVRSLSPTDERAKTP